MLQIYGTVVFNLYDEAQNLINSILPVFNRSKYRLEYTIVQTNNSRCDESREKMIFVEQCAKNFTEAEAQALHLKSVCKYLDMTIRSNNLRQVEIKKFPYIIALFIPYAGAKQDDSQNSEPYFEIFHSKESPFNVSYYCNRIYKYSRASPSCFVVALIYLERIRNRNPNLYLTSRNMQRLLLVAVMVAVKFLDDSCHPNRYW